MSLPHYVRNVLLSCVYLRTEHFSAFLLYLCRPANLRFKSSAVFCSILYVLPAGLLTCCRGTGPVPPSLRWPAAARQPARPTCTAVSTLCSTLNPPMMSGQRTSTCAWALPWKLVSADCFMIFNCSDEAFFFLSFFRWWGFKLWANLVFLS